MFRRTGMLIVSAGVHLMLMLVGAVLIFQVPGIGPDGRITLFVCWMAVQYLVSRWAYSRL